jgi:glutathione S-transferase
VVHVHGRTARRAVGLADKNGHMKLYYRPGDVSLAARLMLHEGGIVLDGDKLGMYGDRTASGADIRTVSPFGDAPALKIADGVFLTQPIAILLHCAHISGVAAFTPAEGTVRHARLLEALGLVGNLHRAMELLSEPLIDDDRSGNIILVVESRRALSQGVHRALHRIEATLPEGDGYWLGDYTPADAYLYTVLRWMPGLNWDLPQAIDLSPYVRTTSIMNRVAARPSTRAVLEHEYPLTGAGP